MIAKIIKGRNFSGCIEYILDKEKDTKLLDAQELRLKNKELRNMETLNKKEKKHASW